MRHRYPAFVMLLLLFVSCGRLEGEFALRRFSDDVFRKAGGSFECRVTEEVQWAYVLKKADRRRDIGVVIQKKEIGWVEVKTRTDYIGLEKRAVHGLINGYGPGEYQIVILDVSDDNSVLGRLKFFVYDERPAE